MWTLDRPLWDPGSPGKGREEAPRWAISDPRFGDASIPRISLLPVPIISLAPVTTSVRLIFGPRYAVSHHLCGFYQSSCHSLEGPLLPRRGGGQG